MAIQQEVGNHSKLELLRHDTTANAPELNRTIYAPELDRPSAAPEVIAILVPRHNAELN